MTPGRALVRARIGTHPTAWCSLAGGAMATSSTAHDHFALRSSAGLALHPEGPRRHPVQPLRGAKSSELYCCPHAAPVQPAPPRSAVRSTPGLTMHLHSTNFDTGLQPRSCIVPPHTGLYSTSPTPDERHRFIRVVAVRFGLRYVSPACMVLSFYASRTGIPQRQDLYCRTPFKSTVPAVAWIRAQCAARNTRK